MHRLFVALSLPAGIRDLLVDTMHDSPELRWSPEEQLHLTLRFIGEVERPQAEDLAAALGRARHAPFSLSLAGCGTFDRRAGGALWAGVAPREPVATLAQRIERACVMAGAEPERRAFHPHITLARWRGRRPEALAPFVQHHGGLTSPSWQVTSFTLFESHLSRHGAHHELITEYPLA